MDMLKILRTIKFIQPKSDECPVSIDSCRCHDARAPVLFSIHLFYNNLKSAAAHFTLAFGKQAIMDRRKPLKTHKRAKS